MESNGLLVGMVLGDPIVFSLVLPELSCNVSDKRVVRVGFTQECRNREHDFVERKSWRPVVFQDLRNDSAVCPFVLFVGLQSAYIQTCRKRSRDRQQSAKGTGDNGCDS